MHYMYIILVCLWSFYRVDLLPLFLFLFSAYVALCLLCAGGVVCFDLCLVKQSRDESLYSTRGHEVKDYILHNI